MVMSKIKSTLQAQLGETKKVSDDECKERGFLLGKYRNQEHEVDLTREQLEEELAKATKLLADTEAKRNEMIDKKRRFENDLSSFRKDIDDMNMQIQKAEQEKTNRDHTIRNLNDEIAHQDELINKLTKEKKYMQESQAKSSEELTQEEEEEDNDNNEDEEARRA